MPSKKPNSPRVNKRGGFIQFPDPIDTVIKQILPDGRESLVVNDKWVVVTDKRGCVMVTHLNINSLKVQHSER